MFFTLLALVFIFGLSSMAAATDKKTSQLTIKSTPVAADSVMIVNSADPTQSYQATLGSLPAMAGVSSSATGLTYTAATGVISMTSGYAIPTTTALGHYDSAYGWGNHAGLYISIGSAPSGTIVGTSDSQALTNKNMSGSGNTWPTFNQSTSGTAAKATILATARAINGVNFDGSAAITIPDKPIVGTIADGVNDSGTYKVYPSSDGTATGTKVTLFTVTAAAHDIKIMNPIGSWTIGEKLEVWVTGTAARGLSYDTAYIAGDTTPGALPTTTVTTKTILMKFAYNGSTFYYVGLAGNF